LFSELVFRIGLRFMQFPQMTQAWEKISFSS